MVSQVKKSSEAQAPCLCGSGFVCKLICANPKEWKETISKLNALHFDKRIRVVRPRVNDSPLPRRSRIFYGGAPSRLLCDIANLLLQEGMDVSFERSWPAIDNEIWVELPVHQIGSLMAPFGLLLKSPQVLH